MRDTDWERMIETHAFKLKKLVERETLKAARKELKKTEVREYLEAYDVPHRKMWDDYIASEIWDAFENI